jgi:hypothetical protein
MALILFLAPSHLLAAVAGRILEVG